MRKHFEDYKNLIWDYNGTLIDDAHLCVRAVNTLLLEHRLPQITLEKYTEIFDFPVRDYYDKLGFKFSDEEFVALSEKFHELYHASLPDARVFPGTIELIKSLPHTHYVLSASHETDLLRMLEQFHLRPLFKAVYGLNDRLARSKVARGLELIEREGLMPSECLMIGDTVHDLEVGTAMGIEVLLVTGGHQDHSRLSMNHHRVHHRS